MVWFFERRGERLRTTTMRDSATSEFVLIRHPEPGTDEIERFDTEAAFTMRIADLEAQLREDGWNLGHTSLLETCGSSTNYYFQLMTELRRKLSACCPGEPSS